MATLKRFFSINNTWKLNLKDKEVIIQSVDHKTVLINDLDVTCVLNKSFLRLEFVFEDHVFYICPGHELPFLGFNSQLYMDQINVLNGKQYSITPMWQRIALVSFVYLLGSLISFWALIPFSVYLLVLFLYFRRTTYTIEKLPAKLVGPPAEGSVTTNESTPLIGSYSVSNPILNVISPLVDKVKNITKKSNNNTSTPNTLPYHNNNNNGYYVQPQQPYMNGQQVQTSPQMTYMPPMQSMSPMQPMQQPYQHMYPMQSGPYQAYSNPPLMMQQVAPLPQPQVIAPPQTAPSQTPLPTNNNVDHK
ncbi:hypothetical protein SAMD00019534_041580 [Acytostelium subglobosum LB1]|uniref:hypothetical protein n=1 Tax=Acytostelium subglobosum LB1 TaxID=1410327 RepID=UPI00064484CA|nr:hypothetical protein SAMD00019534_041580 [Acytostelium subglobosum LB1]GAM20983.1 hypothetical protein SAMD00019534_041580 [Acytostelium subglobosum LB1]|eukprot:XP_012756117.1 hypothetical protein SAMD00019534_041580 [Acytostelium subglobosum LB1]